MGREPLDLDDFDDSIALRRRQRRARARRRWFIGAAIGGVTIIAVAGTVFALRDRDKQSGGGSGATASEAISLDDIASAYRASTAAGDSRFKGKRLGVTARISQSGSGWAGSYAALQQATARVTTLRNHANSAYESAFRGPVNNVVFVFESATDSSRCQQGHVYVFEGICDGAEEMTADGPKITFLKCRLIREVTTVPTGS